MSVEEPTVTGNSTNGVLISVSPRFRLKLLPSSALNAVQFQEQFYLTWYSFLNFPCQLFSISVHLSIFPSSSILFRVTGRVESVSFHHTRGGGTPWKNGDLYNLHETLFDYSQDSEMSLKLYQEAKKKTRKYCLLWSFFFSRKFKGSYSKHLKGKIISVLDPIYADEKYLQEFLDEPGKSPVTPCW